MTTTGRLPPERGGDDLPRDAHLLAALRHAPDRDVEPPPEVTARILAAARAAATPPSKPAPARWAGWASWWSPRFGAVLGTLAVATLVGLMWATRELPPKRAPERMADAPPASPAPVAATSAVMDGSGVPAASAQAAAPTRVDREAPRPRLAAAPATTPPRGVAENAAGTLAPASPVASAEMRRSAPAERAAASVEPTGTAEQPAADAAAQKVAAAPLARSRQEVAAGASLATSVDPLARIDALLAREAPGPTWRHAGQARPHGDAQRQWWADVAEATRGRWTRATHPASAAAPWLTLIGSGGQTVGFWFTTDGALAVQSGTEVWEAPLPPSTRARWEERVSRW